MWKLMMVIAGAAGIRFLVFVWQCNEGRITGFIDGTCVGSALSQIIEANHLSLAMDDVIKIHEVIFDKLRVEYVFAYDFWEAEIERGNGGIFNVRALIGRAKSMHKITTAFINSNGVETVMKELGYLNSTEGS